MQIFHSNNLLTLAGSGVPNIRKSMDLEKTKGPFNREEGPNSSGKSERMFASICKDSVLRLNSCNVKMLLFDRDLISAENSYRSYINKNMRNASLRLL